ncbi:GIY-YIG nuclease family protein [Candidatus Parcubacteria bacterium]|nr:GIY-YIG nuclease family protein [Candidatus Parcubacteria bacterium]
MNKHYYVYLMTNKNNTVIYTGVTNNLKKRVSQHKDKIIKGFTEKYNIVKLVYYEIFNNPYDAISREKQIKAGSRKRKIDLINKVNLKWKDLYFEL